MLIRRSVTRVALAAGCSLLSTLATAQVPAGGDFLVTTYTTGYQLQPRSAMASDGRFVVVWTDRAGRDGSQDGVFAQRFDAAGQPSGADFRVNTYTTGYQGSPVVGMAPSGDSMVVWSEGVTQNMFAQRYDRAGRPLGGEFQVNAYTTFNMGGPAVAMAQSGGFVLTWHGGIGGHNAVYARRFDASGEAVAPESEISVAEGFLGLSDVAMDAAGGFVVVWERYGRLIYGRRFAAGGQPLGAEFRIDTSVASDRSNPSIGMAPSGEFVVAWSAEFQDGNESAVAARRFTASGTPVGSDFLVNTFTTGDQIAGASSVAVDAGGGFVVVWNSYEQDGSLFGAFGQRFRPDGSRVGGEFRMNTYTTGPQYGATLAGDRSGNFVAMWHQIIDNTDVVARRFGGLQAAALSVDGAGNGVLEPGEAVDVRPAWRNSTGASQDFTGTLAKITGPGGATYTIGDGSGGYGVVPVGGVQACTDCYAVSVSNPPSRPATHWDASVLESLAPEDQGQQVSWRLHVGRSFDDVAPSSPFYRWVETLLHRQISAGCTSTSFCPTNPTTRAQVAPLVLSAQQGQAYAPARCGTPLFSDVPATSPFCRWIEELARRGVAGGCGGGKYCPDEPVSRAQMAVFTLATKEPGVVPPACVAGSEMFLDVPASNPFCRWIEELARRGVVGGCGDGKYCPAAAVTREQMSVFIGVTFGITLYGN